MAILVTPETIPLQTALEALRSRGNLVGYAAHDAASTLVTNWVCALGDGCKPEALLKDVDGVIDALRGFRERAAVAMRAAETRENPGPSPSA